MKLYKVKALSVGGANKKVYNSGDTVKENNFPVGRAEELVKQGFLIPIGENSETAPASKEEQTPDFVEKPEEAPKDLDEKKDETTSDKRSEEEQAIYEGMTRNELMAELELAGVAFGKNDSKETLYKIWKSEKDNLKDLQ